MVWVWGSLGCKGLRGEALDRADLNTPEALTEAK